MIEGNGEWSTKCLLAPSLTARVFGGFNTIYTWVVHCVCGNMYVTCYIYWSYVMLTAENRGWGIKNIINLTTCITRKISRTIDHWY